MIVALFDFDGTITTHETMPAFVKASTSRSRFLLGYALLWPAIVGYKLGLISGVAVRAAIVKAAYTGKSASDLEHSGQMFAEEYLENCLRPEAIKRIKWHQDEGHKVLIVSGGLDTYLRPWAAKRGLDLVCSRLQEQNRVMTGRYLGSQCVKQAKVQAVRDRFDLSSCERIYAYGDTPEDHELLALATDPFYQQMPTAGC